MKPRTLPVLATSLVTALLGMSAGNAHADDQYAKVEQLYNTYCVQCHGINRDGNGINSKNMAVKPRDHTERGMNDTPDDELHKAIKEGGASVNKSVLMPRWDGVLTEAQISDLVGYLRHISKK